MKVLMVCLGNICRSPLAEGLLQKKINEKNLDWEVDSAGTGSWHVGEKPHKGSLNVAAQNGLDISHQRARQFKASDLDDFDLIIAMDSQNYQDIIAVTNSSDQKEKVKLLLNFSNPQQNKAVPDPYFTGNFEEVYQMIDEACEALIKNYT